MCNKSKSIQRSNTFFICLTSLFITMANSDMFLYQHAFYSNSNEEHTIRHPLILERMSKGIIGFKKYTSNIAIDPVIINLKNNFIRNFSEEDMQYFTKNTNNYRRILLGQNKLTSFNMSIFAEYNFEMVTLDNNQISSLLSSTHDVKINVLNLSHNMLSILESEIFDHMPLLKDLDLSYNNLLYLPNDFLLKNVELYKLSLSNNNLGSIQLFFVSNIKNLLLIDLSSNQLQYQNISEIICGTKLLAIDMSNNPILSESLNNSMVDCEAYRVYNKTEMQTNLALIQTRNRLRFRDSITSLKFDNTGMSKFFITNTSQLSGKRPIIVTISLKNNPLRSLSESIFDGFDKLSFVYLSNCQISTVDEKTFANNQHLIYLDLEGNPIKSLHFIQHLVANTIAIHLSDIQLVDDGLKFHMSKIQKLSMINFKFTSTVLTLKDFCEMRQLQSVILMHGNLQKIEVDKNTNCNVEVVKLDYNAISNLKFLKNMREIKELSCTHCQLKVLNLKHLRRNKQLRILSLVRNKIDRIIIFNRTQLSNLQQLTLDYNAISNLKFLKNMREIKELSCTHCQLKVLNLKHLRRNKQLRILSLVRNKIDRIIIFNRTQLSNLQQLDLRRNKLNSFTFRLFGKNLKYLDLRFNKLRKLYGDLGISSLETLYLPLMHTILNIKMVDSLPKSICKLCINIDTYFVDLKKLSEMNNLTELIISSQAPFKSNNLTLIFPKLKKLTLHFNSFRILELNGFFAPYLETCIITYPSFDNNLEINIDAIVEKAPYLKKIDIFSENENIHTTQSRYDVIVNKHFHERPKIAIFE
ncbi:hypothetical protein GJ496_007154 [Pomphorhynchus laevis]|nr:hypothetical protein GJ496_007154 [Pomphorhynchus laevis]